MVLRTSKIQNSAQMTFRKRDRPRFFERGANSHTTLTAQGRPVVRVCPVEHVRGHAQPADAPAHVPNASAQPFKRDQCLKIGRLQPQPEALPKEGRAGGLKSPNSPLTVVHSLPTCTVP